MSNFTPFITAPTSFKINSYNIICFDDMGRFNYYNKDDKTQILPDIINNFMIKIYDKYINTEYKECNGVSLCSYSLKPGLKKKFKYTFTHQNDVYVINITYDL